MYANVLIEYQTKSLDKTFTYMIPSKWLNTVQVGMVVGVPFGKKNVRGIVLEINNKCELSEIKEISSIEENLILNKELLLLGQALSRLTLCSLMSAYLTILPNYLKINRDIKDHTKYTIKYTFNGSNEELQSLLHNNKINVRQSEILTALLDGPIYLEDHYSVSSLKTLLHKQIIKKELEPVNRLIVPPVVDYNIILTEEQEAIVKQIDFTKASTNLIYGVTGSGKTEVYFALIDQVIKNNQQALILVPEISLTTHLIKRFYERFGTKVAVFHSGLSIGEKHDEYEKILRNEVSIVIGTRSAIFVPLTNLKLLIIDEEHSENYKQDSNPRYHALDIALFRSAYNNCPLILGSATPSFEAMARAQKGIYNYFCLTKRPCDVQLPTVKLIDMAPEMKNGQMIISSSLLLAIKKRLLNKEQTMLLLNRRGFSTIITCQSCGYTYKCPHCEISLTYHKTTANLRCHYCGYTVKKDDICPDCHEKALTYYGLGTQKVVEYLQNILPEARILRMDADTTTRKGIYEQYINAIMNHEYDIIVGTQMISKGFDFPLVTLVGVINADSSLNIPNFRSYEKAFSLLNQVAGRAGRGKLAGEVIIQTFNPDNYALKYVEKHDFYGFYLHEMKTRHLLKYPPYYYLISLTIKGKDYNRVSTAANKAKIFLSKHLLPTTTILGPTTANMFRINDYLHFNILIKYQRDSELLTCLKELDQMISLMKDVSLIIDINPQTF